MSNVTPQEIVEISARVWDVSILELKWAVGQSLRGPKRFTNSAFAAKVCALVLIRRHTGCGIRKASEVVGFGAIGADYAQKLMDDFALFASRRDMTRKCIEAIECEIDELHEKRAESDCFCDANAKTLLEESSLN